MRTFNPAFFMPTMKACKIKGQKRDEPTSVGYKHLFWCESTHSLNQYSEVFHKTDRNT
jgi:hypothetical protein